MHMCLLMCTCVYICVYVHVIIDEEMRQIHSRVVLVTSFLQEAQVF